MDADVAATEQKLLSAYYGTQIKVEIINYTLKRKEMLKVG